MKKIIGLIGFVATVVVAILYGSHLGLFIDVPSLVLVTGATVFLLITRHNVKDILSLTDEVTSSGITAALFSGAIGNIIGMVQILQHLSDPTHIGPALALSLLSVFYGLVLAAIFYAVKKEKIGSFKNGVIGFGLGLSTLVPYGMMMMSFQMKG